MDDLELLGILKQASDKFDQTKDDQREIYKLINVLRTVQSKQFSELIFQCESCKIETKRRMLEHAKNKGFEVSVTDNPIG